MFTLNRDVGGIRTGELKGFSSVKTPCFFATSDFGGGGTNVARFLAYSDLLKSTNIQLLLNYYYLDIESDLSPRFDTQIVEEFSKLTDVEELINAIKNRYLNHEDAVKVYEYTDKAWKPMVLLDSGSGNILRNKIRKGELTKENHEEVYSSIVHDFLEFLSKHKFDIGIAMDFAEKNTYKAGERKNPEYIKQVEYFSSLNFELLDLTLKVMKNDVTPAMNIFAPLHGNSLAEYEAYLRKILEIEKTEKVRFSGFAIGGLGNPNIANREKWNLPESVNGKVKASLYLYKVINLIRSVLKDEKDDRPIHVLGAASPYNLISLLLAGADTFDCHSAWRRASDGNEKSKVVLSGNYTSDDLAKANFSKILVPLLDTEGNVIEGNAGKYLKFIHLNKISKHLNFDSAITRIYSIQKIIELYCGNREQNYFAKVLIYCHALHQYDAICRKMSDMKTEKEIEEFIARLPSCPFKSNLLTFRNLTHN